MKILFCVHSFQQGGISKALQSLLSVIDSNKADISIFCSCQEGAYLDYFRRFKVLPQDLWLWSFSVNYKKLRIFRKIFVLLVKIVRKVLMMAGIDLLQVRFKQLARKLSKNEYDVVVAYAEGLMSQFVANIENVNRIAWMHIDYNRYLKYGECPLDSIIHRYKAIVSPSAYSARSLIDKLPEGKDKVVHLPNLVDEKQIRSLSLQLESIDERFDTSSFTIVSVGRICHEKQFHEIPSIAEKLKNKGLDFKWYIIGGGSQIEVDYMLDKIRQYGLSESVVWLGEKNNPYPYMKSADCVAVLSISETFSYVIFEARVLGVPVVTTDFGTAAEIMEERYGIVSTLRDFDDAVLSLVGLGSYFESSGLKKYEYDNGLLLERYYELWKV